ncbi:MAG: hypothetical protein K9H25_18220 [Rhodospirillum sp.]|nr:hypothetical protein [Rhodospirillum sp.]MCF8490834.1 hypothetical protein [Rhodospirillum sp.]MCF8501393.1 hypothetical protein [Rhodospirillum sp.]
MRPPKFALLGLVALFMASCRAVPIEDVAFPRFPSGSETLSMAQIQHVTVEAASGPEWIVREDSPSRLIATHGARTHVAKVSLDYTRDGFSIGSLDSTNLDQDSGKIDPNDNRWVAKPRKDILRATLHEAANRS